MDIEYLLLIQKIREALGGTFDSLMLQWTAMGEGTLTFLLMAAIYWCVDKRVGQYMGFNVSIACTLNQFLKNVFRIERPWLQDERVRPVNAALAGAGGYSFPSGHSSRAVATWGAAGVCFRREKERRISGILCWLITALILFSRNYLGVHTAKDVLGALGMGIVVLFLTDKALALVEKQPKLDWVVCGIGCLICFLPMLKVGCLTNAGAGIGILIGWFIERRCIHFEVEGTFWERVVRFGIGTIFFTVLWKSVSPVLSLFMLPKYAGFFSSFATGIYIFAVYPFLWCAWKRIWEKADKERKQRVTAILIVTALILGICAAAVIRGQVQRNAVRAEQKTQEAQQTQETQEMQQTPESISGGADSDAAVQNEEAQSFAEAWYVPTEPLQIIAHRGYSGVFPENTLAAFAGALDIGVDFIELDVQLTKDGQVVVFHDSEIKRITGEGGTIVDYSLEELRQMDAGSWFSAAYAGETIPTLEEVLALVKDSDCSLYLELKDIGAAEGFEEAVLETVKENGMLERCLFASFNYEYLRHLKELDDSIQILYITTSGLATLPEEYPAEYYGLYVENVTADTIRRIHAAGRKAFVWTIDTPQQIANVRAFGADGVVTNYPGMAKVAVCEEYTWLVENFERSFTMPGLYDPGLPDNIGDYVVQGLTRAGNQTVISAYSYSGEANSILYILDNAGKLQKIVDLGFKAHTGGISYDEGHDLLWVTGPSGHVYAICWSDVRQGTYQGEILVDFDAGLINHNGGKVASFLTWNEGKLYVGSYVDGASGLLNRYDLTDVNNPELEASAEIPERIQGVTFQRDVREGTCYMLLTQGYQTEDSHLLKFVYDESETIYAEALESHVLPEGVEQPQMTANGLYLLFESAVRPYRPTARIANDQIYIVR